MRLGEPARGDLVAERAQGRRRRTDEPDSRILAARGELGAFAEKPVPRVNRLAPRGAGDLEHRVDVEISGRATPLERDCAIDPQRVQRARIVGRVDSDGLDPELGRGAGDAQRDLASIGDQQPLHGLSPQPKRISRC